MAVRSKTIALSVVKDVKYRTVYGSACQKRHVNVIKMIFKVRTQTEVLRKRDDCNAGILSFFSRPGMVLVLLVL